jgi:TatD DNase family protein
LTYFPKITDYIDIHSHNPENEEGVFRILNIFTSDFPEIPADRPISVGLHPWHLTEESISEMPGILKQAAVAENVMAFGEAGLDAVIKTPIEQQLTVFRTQIELSIELKKPLVIHCVRVFPVLFNLRKEYGNSTPWIIHGFNASQEIAAECVKMGIFISFSQRLFRNPEKAQNIVKVVPHSMVFAETDDDSMPIQEVYKSISTLYDLSEVELKSIIFRNYSGVFHKD